MTFEFDRYINGQLMAEGATIERQDNLPGARTTSENTSEDVRDALEQLYAILRLAQANFPRPIGVQISTVGSSPHASMTVPYYLLKEIVDKAKTAMEAGR